jgi:DNA processing protein
MTTRHLTDTERLDWLRLSRSENVGTVTFHQLIARFGGAGAALQALPELARRGGRESIRIPTRAQAEAWLKAVERLGARLLASCEPEYPRLLAACEDAPPLLSVKGDLALFARPTIAIVGARNASLNGRNLARTLARDLARQAYVVVSGLARGIDGAAHEGALADSGAGGGTIAVIAGGLDIVYPPEHAHLQQEIARRGALVAEMAPGTQPLARHFPRRNRVISGLSLGIIVVEAAARSGSLITARFAADQGREVFAVPGSPLDPRCKGSNGLLRDGATLVEEAADVIASLAGRSGFGEEREAADFAGSATPQPNDGELVRARNIVTELLSMSPVAVDELIRQCQFSPAVVMAVLLELELAGRLERHPGNRVSLVLLP